MDNRVAFYKKGIKEQSLFRKFSLSVDAVEKIYQNNLNCIDAFEIDFELDVGIEECKDMLININNWRKLSLKYKNSLNEAVGLDLQKIVEQPKKVQVHAALHPNYLHLRINNDMKQLALLYIHWKKNLKVLWEFVNTSTDQVSDSFLMMVEESFENIFKICMLCEKLMLILKKKITVYQNSIIRYQASSERK